MKVNSPKFPTKFVVACKNTKNLPNDYFALPVTIKCICLASYIIIAVPTMRL